MIADRDALEQQRDQALRDLVDLERQVAEREIPDAVAETLRRRYEVTAARAIDALATADDPRIAARAQRRASPRIVAYLVAAFAAVFAAVVLLPQYVLTRPEGGFVSGNEVVQSAPGPPGAPPRDLSKVTESEMELVVAANPRVLGMRLALADRYLKKEQYDKAAEHLGVALKQDPGNPSVQAQVGWLLFKMGETDPALRFVDRALEIDPRSQDALWFKANILFEGRKDPVGAVEVLRKLARRDDLPADLRGRVNRLTRSAERAGEQ